MCACCGWPCVCCVRIKIHVIQLNDQVNYNTLFGPIHKVLSSINNQIIVILIEMLSYLKCTTRLCVLLSSTYMVEPSLLLKTKCIYYTFHLSQNMEWRIYTCNNNFVCNLSRDTHLFQTLIRTKSCHCVPLHHNITLRQQLESLQYFSNNNNIISWPDTKSNSQNILTDEYLIL